MSEFWQHADKIGNQVRILSQLDRFCKFIKLLIQLGQKLSSRQVACRWLWSEPLYSDGRGSLTYESAARSYQPKGNTCWKFFVPLLWCISNGLLMALVG